MKVWVSQQDGATVYKQEGRQMTSSHQRYFGGTPSYEWNHPEFILLCLAYFPEHVLKAHPCCTRCQDVIPLQG